MDSAGRNGTNGSEHKRKVGRPSTRTEAKADTICNRLAEGESLASICRDEAMPDYVTITRWLIDDEEFRKRYVAAREVQAEYLADQILDIADDSTNDFMERKDGSEYCDQENIQRSKLRVDARKWVAAKLLPKKYGDRPNETHVTTVTNNFVVLSEQDRADLIQRRASALRS